jgi:glutamate synthase (NADPH/NADH) small chain
MVEAIECLRMKPAQKGRSGSRSPVAIPGSEFRIPVDMVIKSIGQHPASGFLSMIRGIGLTDGKISVDPGTLQTTNPKYFAGGDCINGGKEVVNAAADGKKAAQGIIRYLNVENV